MRGDYDLWTAWVAGDDASGNELVSRHFLTVYRFLRAKLPDQADDLTQATFAGCIEGKHRFRAQSEFRAFILGIARKQLLRYLEGRGQLLGGRAVTEVSMADIDPSPSAALAEAEERTQLLAAIRTIPLDFQIVLELKYWQELDTDSIAQVLEIPAGTVKSRLSRARGHLQDAITDAQRAPSSVALPEAVKAALAR